MAKQEEASRKSPQVIQTAELWGFRGGPLRRANYPVQKRAKRQSFRIDDMGIFGMGTVGPHTWGSDRPTCFGCHIILEMFSHAASRNRTAS